MNKNPKISALCSTYGRYSKLTEVVSCFIDQNYDNKELIILNNHPIPLYTKLPQVIIYNEPIYPTLGDCRNRLLELANGDYIRTWDDDDLYMPWTLSQGIENIGNSVAWKPKRSWFWLCGKAPKLAENVFEASILIKKDIALKYGYKSSGGDEHNPLMEGLNKEGGCQNKEMGELSSYIYKWGWGTWHISGSLGSDTIENRTKIWKEHNNDIGDQEIKYIDMSDTWKLFNSIKIKV